ncbi:hypothetical protein TNCT_466911 [Trichonephila clavata]|uniref:PWWP domain-containing protein n=1 Tax=Trichonephila clavata TaxID=2740835 RepID=A0A8X6GUG7_TRICU|nr:hypothetical protein TNCT_466911 [Trichonephila clavata]
MSRQKKIIFSDDFDDSPERKCKNAVTTERPYPYELVWGKMNSYPVWPGIKIKVQMHCSPSQFSPPTGMGDFGPVVRGWPIHY